MTEILAPAGDNESALAAINAGADAIYLGLTSFSARSSARNFDLQAFEKLAARARLFGVKVYVAMNTLVKQSELESFVQTAVEVWNAGADAIIIQDAFLGKYLKRTYPQMVLHLSTQAGVCNVYGAEFAKECGFSRVILARETKLEDIKQITKIIETEVFVQGALCTCFSGQCYLSSFAGGNSGNRGKCKQPCRKRYRIDRDGFDTSAYRISLSDLSVGEDIKTLVEAGVSSFKIEGRMRRPEYVSAAVSFYKKILSGSVGDGDLSALKRTYNRGNYTKGLAFGQDKSFISSAVQGHIGEYIGTVTVVNGKYFCANREKRTAGDGFKILRGGSELCGAVFGGEAKGGFYLESSVRLKNGDKVFITTDVALNNALALKSRKIPVEISFYATAGKAPKAVINGKEYTACFTAQKAGNKPLKEEDIKKCFNKVDIYPFEVSYVEIVADGVFIPLSELNSFRRKCYGDFYDSLTKSGNERIESIQPIQSFTSEQVCTKTAVVSRSLNGIKADIGILKPDDYFVDLSALYSSFNCEKYLYLPPYLTNEEIEKLEEAIVPFDGVYGEGNYAIPLAKKLNKKLFAGTGLNLSNSVSLFEIKADYVALSKELTVRETQSLQRGNTFCLTAGGIKVMDLIYCPFSRTCSKCDKRNFYTLADEENRAFPLRRYKTSECRFELFNCNPLVGKNYGTGTLADLTCEQYPAEISAIINDIEKLKKHYKNYTKGHTENPVL